MDQYPRSKRPLDRGTVVTAEMRQVTRQFGREYFDGTRLEGYGGYHYHPRFWRDTVTRFRDYYQLRDDAAILDVGCAKGFMLHDFKELMPQSTIAGIDISEYAIDHAIESVKPVLQLGNARALPYADNSFDLVTALSTVHNLPLEECKQALREIQRVSREHAFIVVDAWHNEDERRRLENWVLTCRTAMHVDDWKALFEEVGYTGDYFWFVAE